MFNIISQRSITEMLKNKKSIKQSSLSSSDDMVAHSPLRSPTEVNKLLWYTFNTLVDSHDGTAHISTLKVLISSLGRVLGFEKSEELLNIEGRNNIDFPLLCKIIDKELLQVNSNTPPKGNAEDPSELYRVCWNIYYDHHYTKSEFNLYKSDEQNLFKMWMIFILLSEDDENGIPNGPPVIDREEMGILFRSFVSISGLAELEDKIQEVETATGNLKFIEFKDVFIGLFGSKLAENDLKFYLTKIYELYIDDIFQKGMLCKRGHQVKSWKDRWFVLRKKTLKYFPNSQEKELKGCINIVKDCRIEVVSDKGGSKPNRFIIHTSSKPYECSAADTRTRSEWVTVLNLAINKCEDPEFHYHKHQSKQRQARRREKRKREEEEVKKRLEDEETLRRLQEEYTERHRQDEMRLREQMEALEAEKLAREDLESRLLKEAALREVEKRRLRELEEVKRELQRLLEEERQAKRDEEIVRQLQANLLEEESQKRAELERLRQEQEELLRQERQEREGLEGLKEKQEQNLREAQERLQQLEIEREAANAYLQEATSKLEKAEKDRTIAEAKMKLWKTPTIGLARPVLPKTDPFVTHRGEGAFCDKDFSKKDGEKSDHQENKEIENEMVIHKPERKNKNVKSDKNVKMERNGDSNSNTSRNLDTIHNGDTSNTNPEKFRDSASSDKENLALENQVNQHPDEGLETELKITE
ncbi:switch-associated protein 70-like isoform X1 [Saccostrea echinata]|uniref:switch-associated protein 70-like isoform X1 n=2 Tax=Saccostrea echinata TaxID=191078 RepID=UPI002A83D306|nr:switch-associated protein 70-like isoform X1 [Saccostrea echinata]